MMQPDRKLSPLFRLALKSGAVEAIALHILRGESPNGRDAAGLTPLMIAAIHNQSASCAKLISLGADASLLSAGGRTAVELAIEHGHLTLAAVLAPPASWDSAAPDVAGIRDALPVPSIAGESALDDALRPVAENVSADEALATAADAHPGTARSKEVECVDDLNGWAADETVSAPAHDANCVAAAREVQRRISEHRRISDETDWSAIEFDLPEARMAQTSLQREDLAAIGCLVASGLHDGYVTADDFRFALETDCAPELERAREVLGRILDDLGVLVECDGLPLPRVDQADGDDELASALDILADDLLQLREPVHAYLTEARGYDLIKREDEERLGRQMDSALGALTRVLVSLSEHNWLLFFSQDSQSGEGQELGEGDGGAENVEPVETVEAPENGDEVQGDFRSYVQSVRDGAPENGRDAAVPRPAAPDLSRMLEAAIGLEQAAADVLRSSIVAYETARDRLVTANLRLAISLAHKYRYSGLPLEDLIQEANIGLMRAAERFDFRRGFKFSTYATWWIRQSIGRSVQDTSRTIRVPVYQSERINLVTRARRELEYGRASEVRPAEIADYLSLPLQEVVRIIRSDIKVVLFGDCGPGLEPCTPDPSSIIDSIADPSQTSCDRSLTAALERMLAELDDRGREVTIARFGFDGAGGKSLEEVGQKIGVTRERIRQIEAKVLSKLRHTSRREVLAPYAPIFRRTTD